MDAETLKVVTLIVGLITATGTLIGALGGALINQYGARKAVKDTLEGQRLIAQDGLEGQRILARDAALRDWRRQQVTPYLEAAEQRMLLWTKMTLGFSNPDEATKLTLLAEVTNDNFNSLVSTCVKIPDNAFRAAFAKFVAAEGKGHSQYTKAELMDIGKNMRVAIVELNKAAEDYLHP
jgi:hypothetical protein